MNDCIDVVVTITATDTKNIGTKTSNVIDHGAINILTSATTFAIELVTENINLIFELLDAIAMSALTILDDFLDLKIVIFKNPLVC